MAPSQQVDKAKVMSCVDQHAAPVQISGALLHDDLCIILAEYLWRGQWLP
jgi:hypothetical protein